MPSIQQSIVNTDYFRRSPFRIGGPGGHKEWLHFCVYGPEIDALINFSIVDDVSAAARPGGELARMTVLVRTDGWDGAVELYDDDEAYCAGGHIYARLGPNRVEFVDGVYRISVSLRSRPVTMQLELAPLTMPSLAHNVQFTRVSTINWLVIPRLRAHGYITVDGRRYSVDGSLAYHDHNWGHFDWGHDFAWEWGFGLPSSEENPWTVVFVRLSDRAHTRAKMQALFLWRGADQYRVFRASEVRISQAQLLRASEVVKFPRAMALVSPQSATGVPAELRASASADGGELSMRFQAYDVAQVLVPNDRNVGVTIINEVSGVVSVEGQVGHETVQMEGHAIFEFLSA